MCESTAISITASDLLRMTDVSGYQVYMIAIELCLLMATP